MLVYSGKPCSSDRYVIDRSALEERDHPTLGGGEYDHDACGLLGDGSACCLSDPCPAEKISVGPADTDTLWSRKMCDIYLFSTAEIRQKAAGGRHSKWLLPVNSMICSANTSGSGRTCIGRPKRNGSSVVCCVWCWSTSG